jgi:hypothetical protein
VYGWPEVSVAVATNVSAVPFGALAVMRSNCSAAGTALRTSSSYVRVPCEASGVLSVSSHSTPPALSVA